MQNPLQMNQQNPLENDPQMQQYFDTLPKYVQENIKQSGAKFCSLAELQQCAANLTQSQQ
ncbi:hypothetical protein [Zongyangia hominis]|uniref:Uncharacterized protein n=1 Tax=Zongyangia hominis TaxID=2763677 RepID=A0A926EBZ0_9FIRM|nr:hypothetical protein [Zongyangia hominis]MBC8569316.1 hypothetical protein [Zongyangia hominis]